MTGFLAVPALVVFLALVVLSRRWTKTDARSRRERKIAQALGSNAGMSVTQVAAMFPPKTKYDHRRLVKFSFHIPAQLIGEHPPGSEKRAAAEVKLRATINGWMGYVTVEWDHAPPKGSTGTITLTRAEVPKPIPMSLGAAKLVDTGRFDLPIGLAAGGRQISWNISQVPHCLVHGATNSGKTQAIITLARAAIARGHQVYVCDAKRFDFREWKEDGVCPVAITAEEITTVVGDVRREMERRYRDYKARRLTAMLRSGELPSILLVADEMQSMIDMLDSTPRKPAQAMRDLRNIVLQGRAAGVHLLIGTQYATVDAVGGGVIRNQCDQRIALGSLSKEAKGLTQVTLDPTAYPPGRGIVSWPGYEVEVQVGLSGSRVGSSPELLRGPRVATAHGVSGQVFGPPGPLEQPLSTVVSSPVSKGLSPPLTPEVVARIVKLRGDGWTERRIAAELEVSAGVVHKYARQVPARQVPAGEAR